MATRIKLAAIALVVGVVAALAGPALADRFMYFGASTGILKGVATSYQTTPAVAADVVGLWTGTCNSGTFLKGDGTCAAAGAGSVTSVQAAGTGIFAFTGGPVTGTGTLTLTQTGTSGGVPYFSAAGTLSSSSALTASRLILGGGAGSAPTVLASLGTTTTLLHGNAAGAPTFGAVSLTADVSGTTPVANGGTNLTAAADDNAMVGNGTTWETKALTSCSAATSAVTYNTSTNAFGCNTIASGSTLTATQVGFGDGSNLLSGSSRFLYTQSGNDSGLTVAPASTGTATLTIGNSTSGSAAALTIPAVTGTASGNNFVLTGSAASTSGTGGGVVIQSGSQAGGNNDGALTLRCRSGGCPVDIQAGSAGAGVIRIDSPTGTRRITIDGSKSASTGLQFVGYGAGSLSTDSSGNVTSSSDARMKRDIRAFDRGLEVVMGLHPVQFGWAESTGLDQTKDDYTGFTAQDVESVLPEAVGYDRDGMRSVADRAIIAALVNSIKQQETRIRELESRLH